MLLDFHSHILPGVDDGSRDVEESCGLLNLLGEQGVDAVIATPHFEANRESVRSFMHRRQKAFEQLNAVITSDMPKIILGAEVAYYPGISRLEELQDLCIEGTDLLLLEMPMGRWNKHEIDELVNLSSTRRVRVIVAHVERYMSLQDKSTIRALCESDALLQINASSFVNASTRRKSVMYLKKGICHVIGSDCHNLRSRKPKIGEAYEIVRNRLGEDFVCQMINFGKKLIIK